MQFSKKTLVVMMCAALQAGVVMASEAVVEKTESTDLSSGGDYSKTVQNVTIFGQDGAKAKANHYYALVDSIVDPNKENNIQLGDVTVDVKNTNDTTFDEESKKREGVIVAGGFVGDVIGEKSKSVVSADGLNVTIVNSTPGQSEEKDVVVVGSSLFVERQDAYGEMNLGSYKADIRSSQEAGNVRLYGLDFVAEDHSGFKASVKRDADISLVSEGATVGAAGVKLDVKRGSHGNADFSNVKVDGKFENTVHDVFGVYSDVGAITASEGNVELRQLIDELKGIAEEVTVNSFFGYVYANNLKSKDIFNRYFGDGEYEKLRKALDDAFVTGNMNEFDKLCAEAYQIYVDKDLYGKSQAGGEYDPSSRIDLTFSGKTEVDVSGAGRVRGVQLQAKAKATQNALFNAPVNVQVASFSDKAADLEKEIYAKDAVALKVHSEEGGVSKAIFNAPVTLSYAGAPANKEEMEGSAYLMEVSSFSEGDVGVEFKKGLSVKTPNNAVLVALKSYDSSISAGKNAQVEISGPVYIDAGENALRVMGGKKPDEKIGLVINNDGGDKVVINGRVVVGNRADVSMDLSGNESYISGDVEVEGLSTLNLLLSGEGVHFDGWLNDNYDVDDYNKATANVVMTSNAVWNVSAGSSYHSPNTKGENVHFSTLVVDPTSVVNIPDMQDKGAWVFEVKQLSGEGGTFVMPFDVSKNTDHMMIFVGDRLEGVHYLDLQLSSESDGLAAVGSLVAGIGDINKNPNPVCNGNFVVPNRADGLFWRHVSLTKKPHSEVSADYDANPNGMPFPHLNKAFYWVISSIDNIAPADKPTPLVDSIVSSRLAGHALWSGRLADDTLMERLGDIRLSGEESNGLWIRTKHSRAKLDDVYSLKMNTHHYELGYDYSSASDNGRVFWGGSFNWDDGKADLRKGDSKLRSVGIGLYRSQTFDNGWYVDTIARIDRQRNKLKSTDADGKAYDGSVNQWGFSLSGEVGRTFDIAKGMFVQPEAQLTFGRLNGKSFTTSNDVSVDSDAVKALISRIGVKAGMTFDSNKGNVYAKADLLREWMGKDVVSLATKDGSLEVTEKNHKTWGRVGLGANYHFNKAFSAHGSFDYDIKSRWGDHASVNVGVRYSF